MLPILAPAPAIGSGRHILFPLLLDLILNVQKLPRRLVPLHVVHSHLSAAYLSPVEIIYRQDSRSLILISQKGEPLGLAGLLVAGEAHVDYFAEL